MIFSNIMNGESEVGGAAVLGAHEVLRAIETTFSQGSPDGEKALLIADASGAFGRLER